jgi:hypothetical protein
MHHVIGQPDGAGQPVGRGRQVWTRHADQRKRRVLGGLSEVTRDDLDCAAAGDFPCPMSAHAVADDEKAGRRIGVKPVLMVSARETDIRSSPI